MGILAALSKPKGGSLPGSLRAPAGRGLLLQRAIEGFPSERLLPVYTPRAR